MTEPWSGMRQVGQSKFCNQVWWLAIGLSTFSAISKIHAGVETLSCLPEMRRKKGGSSTGGSRLPPN